MSKQQLQHVTGLRGLAIMLVVLYHALPGICPNGFLGVDVFFVISGYFLIGRQLQDNSGFSLREYAKRRAARVLPPYLGLILLVILGSVLVFAGADIASSGKLEKACLTATGNWYLDANSGSYFSASTRTYPLMHLWYMGVLLQAYALFGLLFWVWRAARLGRRVRMATLCAIGLASVVAAHLQLNSTWLQMHGGCYYWTCARLWEFAFGGMLALLPPAQPGKGASATLALSCALLAVLAFCPVKQAFLYNGVGALLGGAAIWAGRACPGGRLLENRAMLWLGEISFALYLVHWPLICGGEYLLRESLQPIHALPLLCLVLLCAWVFFRCLEKPRFKLWVPAALYLLCCGLHREVGTLSSGGRLNAVPVPETSLATLENVPLDSALYEGASGIVPNLWSQGAPPEPLLQWIGDGSEAPDFVVMGDSHAFDLAAGMDALSSRNGWHGVFLGSYVVPFWGCDSGMRGAKVGPGNYCDKEKMLAVMDWLRLQPSIKTVVIAQFWQSRMAPHTLWSGVASPDTLEEVAEWRAREFQDFCRRLDECGKRVLVLTDSPTIPAASPHRVLRAGRLHHMSEACVPSLCRSRQDYQNKNARFNAHLDKLQESGCCRVFHREGNFFRTDVFYSLVDGELMHRDSHHLTQKGAAKSLEGMSLK